MRNNIQKRLEALEGRKEATRPMRWHRVIVDRQSKADALASYERQHGTIGTTGTDGIIYRVVVDPISINAEGALQ